jgi:hypothetical protein
MNYRSIRRLAILGTIFFAPGLVAQTEAPDSKPEPFVRALETKLSDSKPASPVRIAKAKPFAPKPKSPVRFSKTRFVLLSAAVYGAALTDMHQTLEVRKSPWWYETDPLAKPFVRLPAPAYYASGLAMATSLNWLSWTMAHSRRWHRLAPIPQSLSISGNLHGFHSNRF